MFHQYCNPFLSVYVQKRDKRSSWLRSRRPVSKAGTSTSKVQGGAAPTQRPRACGAAFLSLPQDVGDFSRLFEHPQKC